MQERGGLFGQAALLLSPWAGELLRPPDGCLRMGASRWVPPECPREAAPPPSRRISLCPPLLEPQRAAWRRVSAGGRAGLALHPAGCPSLCTARAPPLTACLWFSFQAERPALNVVIFPLLHEGLTNVIRDVPMVHLDEITLFKSRVAEEPPNLWW